MTNYPYKVAKNDPTKKGQLAGKKVFYCGSRFAVYPIHTRFDAVTWFVDDSDYADPITGMPETIFQEDTFEAAATKAECESLKYDCDFCWD